MSKSKQPKVSIRCNQWGNWYGYIGGKKVTEFYRSSQQSQQEAAETWLAEQLLANRERH